jgi:hypothetical protein
VYLCTRIVMRFEWPRSVAGMNGGDAWREGGREGRRDGGTEGWRKVAFSLPLKEGRMKRAMEWGRGERWNGMRREDCLCTCGCVRDGEAAAASGRAEPSIRKRACVIEREGGGEGAREGARERGSEGAREMT